MRHIQYQGETLPPFTFCPGISVSPGTRQVFKLPVRSKMMKNVRNLKVVWSGLFANMLMGGGLHSIVNGGLKRGREKKGRFISEWWA